MTDNSVLKRFSSRGTPDAFAPTSEADGEEIEDFTSFGWLRGMRDRAVALELRKKSGHILAISYPMILEFEFEPSTGILLHVSGGRRICIRGLRLNATIRPNVRLFEGLCRYRVPWIAEADQAAKLQAGKDAVVIEGFDF